jgi:hypothetical protein
MGYEQPVITIETEKAGPIYPHTMSVGVFEVV